MAISLNEALDLIDKHALTVSAEVIPIELSLGRTLAKDHIASFDLPRFDNSSRDGFAVKCADAGNTVTSTDVIYAGDKAEMTLEAHSAIRIMTGAPLPQGCEAIVQFEDVIQDKEKVQLPQHIPPAMYIRYAGEDMKKGTTYLHKGTRITAYSITLLVSQGVTHIPVYRKVKVAVFSSGNELRAHYEEIEAHQLYNSNTPMFLARSQTLGCEVSHIHHSEDTLSSLEDAIKRSLSADLIITTGGMNFGDKDFTKAAFENCGITQIFNRVDIKPGKPLAFGKISDTAIINLPGNPLGAMVAYEIFVRMLLHKMSGENAYYHRGIDAVIGEDYRVSKGMSTATLGTFDGKTFMPLSKQMAGMVSPLQEAQAMMITSEDAPALKKGTGIKIIPILWEFFSPKKENFYTC